ncbi:hypothetical protein LTR94_036596, partial [Friedmanniomyces endolithicus]
PNPRAWRRPITSAPISSATRPPRSCWATTSSTATGWSICSAAPARATMARPCSAIMSRTRPPMASSPSTPTGAPRRSRKSRRCRSRTTRSPA